MNEVETHPLSNLTSEEIRHIASEPLTSRGRALLERISGKPHANLDEMHTDSPDPYGEGLQADFEAAQEALGDDE